MQSRRITPALYAVEDSQDEDSQATVLGEVVLGEVSQVLEDRQVALLEDSHVALLEDRQATVLEDSQATVLGEVSQVLVLEDSQVDSQVLVLEDSQATGSRGGAGSWPSGTTSADSALARRRRALLQRHAHLGPRPHPLAPGRIALHQPRGQPVGGKQRHVRAAAVLHHQHVLPRAREGHVQRVGRHARVGRDHHHKVELRPFGRVVGGHRQAVARRSGAAARTANSDRDAAGRQSVYQLAERRARVAGARHQHRHVGQRAGHGPNGLQVLADCLQPLPRSAAGETDRQHRLGVARHHLVLVAARGPQRRADRVGHGGGRLRQAVRDGQAGAGPVGLGAAQEAPGGAQHVQVGRVVLVEVVQHLRLVSDQQPLHRLQVEQRAEQRHKDILDVLRLVHHHPHEAQSGRLDAAAPRRLDPLVQRLVIGRGPQVLGAQAVEGAAGGVGRAVRQHPAGLGLQQLVVGEHQHRLGRAGAGMEQQGRLAAARRGQAGLTLPGVPDGKRGRLLCRRRPEHLRVSGDGGRRYLPTGRAGVVILTRARSVAPAHTSGVTDFDHAFVGVAGSLDWLDTRSAVTGDFMLSDSSADFGSMRLATVRLGTRWREVFSGAAIGLLDACRVHRHQRSDQGWDPARAGLPPQVGDATCDGLISPPLRPPLPPPPP
eukprot:scaffold6158_cov120-Isochrysis_galbana.AAC.1